MKFKLLNFIPFLIALPSISIGAITMYHNKIPTFIWVQNTAVLVLLGLISYFVVASKFNMLRRKFNDHTILIASLFLILTFINSGMNGVHRWISLGIIKLNVSMIVIPILIISLWKYLQSKSLWFTLFITIAISILLSIQPDASQLTGFAIPMIIMLYSKTDSKILRSFILGILSTLIILSWVLLDSLSSVAYVEGIVTLLGNMGLIWLILGYISLVILPVPFILFPPRNLKLPSICVGLYFIIIMISTFWGNFPVPLMGYGISPIIGYFISITWYANSKRNS